MVDLQFLLEKKHSDEVMFAKLSPFTNLMISASRDQSYRLWNTHALTLQKFVHCQTRISAMAFSPRGKSFAIGMANSKISIGSVKHPDTITNLQFHTDYPVCLWIDDDLNFLIVLTSSGVLISYDIKSQKNLLKINIPWITPSLSFIDETGRHLYSISKKKVLHKLRVGTGQIITSIPLGIGDLYKIIIVNDGTKLYAIQFSGSIYGIDLETKSVLLEKKFSGFRFHSMDIDDVRMVMVVGADKGRVLVLNLNTLEKIELYEECVGDVTDVDLASNGLYFSVGTAFGEVGIFPINRHVNLSDYIGLLQNDEGIVLDDNESYEDYEINEVDLVNTDDNSAPEDLCQPMIEDFDDENCPTCPYCGAMLKQNQTRCPECQSDL
jgi:WD40 repeat protein